MKLQHKTTFFLFHADFSFFHADSSLLLGTLITLITQIFSDDNC